MGSEFPRLQEPSPRPFNRWALAVLATFSLATAARLVEPEEAQADTLNYPHWNMPCEHAPYNVEGQCANYDWGPKHTEAYDDPSEYSSRGYTYRNCTDYVAWKLQSLGVPDSRTRGLGNGGQWYDNAPANARSATPHAGDAAVVPGNPGHVAFVEAVNADGTLTISEYNRDGLGHGGTRTGSASGMGFREFVDFGVHPADEENPGIPRMMIIDSVGNVYAKDGLTDSWVAEYTEGAAKSIAVGATGRMMLVDKSGTAYQKDNLRDSWTRQADSTKQVAVGPTGRMMIIDSAGNAFAKDHPTDSWTMESGDSGTRDIAVGALGRMMLINSIGAAYQKENALNGPWNFQTTTAQRIDVGDDGRMMVIDSAGNVYAKDNPNDVWTIEYGEGNAKDIAAGGFGRMMMIDKAGTAFQKDALTAPWTVQATSAIDVATGATGRMMLIDGDGKAYAKDNPGDAWTLEASHAQAVAVG